MLLKKDVNSTSSLEDMMKEQLSKEFGSDGKVEVEDVKVSMENMSFEDKCVKVDYVLRVKLKMQR